MVGIATTLAASGLVLLFREAPAVAGEAASEEIDALDDEPEIVAA